MIPPKKYQLSDLNRQSIVEEDENDKVDVDSLVRRNSKALTSSAIVESRASIKQIHNAAEETDIGVVENEPDIDGEYNYPELISFAGKRRRSTWYEVGQSSLRENVLPPITLQTKKEIPKESLRGNSGGASGDYISELDKMTTVFSHGKRGNSRHNSILNVMNDASIQKVEVEGAKDKPEISKAPPPNSGSNLNLAVKNAVQPQLEPTVTSNHNTQTQILNLPARTLPQTSLPLPKPTGFGTADTGRLMSEENKHIKKEQINEEVMLLGKKLKDSTVIRKKTVPRTPKDGKKFKNNQEPIVRNNESSHKNTELIEKSALVPSSAKSPDNSVVETAPLDSGFYHNAEELDALVSHFSVLLEKRKRELLLGNTENEKIAPITDEQDIIRLNEEFTACNPAIEIEKEEKTDNDPNTVPIQKELDESVVNESQAPVNIETNAKSEQSEASILRTRSAATRASTTTSCSGSCSCGTHSCSTCSTKATQKSSQWSSDHVEEINSTDHGFEPISKSMDLSMFRNENSSPESSHFGRFNIGTGLPPPIEFESLLDFHQIENSVLEEIPELVLKLKSAHKEVELNEEKIVSKDRVENQLNEPLAISQLPNLKFNTTNLVDIMIKNSVEEPQKEIKMKEKKIEFTNEDLEFLVRSIPAVVIERASNSTRYQLAINGKEIIEDQKKNLQTRELLVTSQSLLSIPELKKDTIKSEAVFEKMPILDSAKSQNPEQSGDPDNNFSKTKKRDRPIKRINSSKRISSAKGNESGREPHHRGKSSINRKKSIMNDNKIQEKNGALTKPVDLVSESADEYETEENEIIEPVDTQPKIRARKNWKKIQQHIRKRALLLSMGANEINLVKEPEPQPAPERNNSLKNSNETGILSPKMYYFRQWRLSDMERYPQYYHDIRIDPITFQIILSLTLKPVIGRNPEREKEKPAASDPESLHKFLVNHGIKINGFSAAARNLYDTVHSVKRRLETMLPLDRAKYPTFDDPGPPLDPTGTPINGDILSDSKESLQLKLLKVERNMEEILKISEVQSPGLLVQRGILYARLEKFSSAMTDYDSAISLDPYNTDGLWHRHQLYLRFNDALAALSDLDLVTEFNKTHMGAFQAKARIFQAIGLYKHAISNYTALIRSRPDNTDAYFNRACLFEIEDEIIFANEDYRTVRLLDPNNDQAIHNIAMYSFQKQLWSDCIQSFSKLISMNPDNADAYMYRGRSYASMSQFADALEDLTRAIRINPDNPSYYYHRAYLLKDQEQNRSLQDFSMAILLDNQSVQAADAYFQRAQLYQKASSIEYAILDYQASIQINPIKAKAYLNLGVLLMRYRQNYKAALQQMNMAIACEPTSLKGYICRGELYEAMFRETMFHLSNSHSTRITRKTRVVGDIDFAEKGIKDFSRGIHLRPSNYLLFLFRGRILLKQGKMEIATRDFHSAFELNTGIAQTFMQRMLILSFQRKYEQVAEEYSARKKKLKLLTDDPQLLLVVAKARLQLGDFEGALNDLCMAGDVVEPQIALQKGICYEYLKNWGMAISEFSKCLSQMPTLAKAYYHRGICKLAANELSGESDLNKSLELEPGLFDAFVSRAALYEATGRYQNAIEDCDRALALEPTSIRAHIIRGTCKSKLGEDQHAIVDFAKAISIEKNSHFAYFNRAVAYENSGDYVNAIKDYSIAILLEPSSKSFKHRALLYWKIKDNENALLDLYYAKKIQPDNVSALILLALSLHRIGRYEDSLNEYSIALKFDPSSFGALLGRGNLYADMGNYTNSRRDYCQVIHVRPSSADSYCNIAYTMRSQNRLQEAWKFFTMASVVDPTNTAALSGRAMVNLELGRSYDAFLDISQGIKLKPNDPSLLTTRGVVYEAMKDDVSALQCFKLAIKADPNYGVAYYNAGNHYLKQNAYEKAIEFYSIAIEKNQKDENSHMNRGIAYLMLNDLKQAKMDMEKANKLNSTSAEVQFNLGYLYRKFEDYAAAEKAFEAAINQHPDDRFAYLCRAEA